MTNALATKIDDSAIEQVLIGGDLSKLSPSQRVQYYKRTCESLGLNPLTRPFDYITLNSKLTLYAKKDCTDQLRSIKSVSIDDVDLQDVGDNFIVKVKGHDSTGRNDVEIGVVRKGDMQGNIANAQMKAVTKAKRRLTLSLCGLGWLDETEVETIPDAKPVSVAETGEIIDGEVKPVPAPTGERPYSPEALKERIQVLVDSFTGKNCTDGQRTSVKINLSAMTGSEDNYHTLLAWLVGEPHVSKLSNEQVLALAKWIHVTKDADDQWIPDALSILEAKSAFEQALKDQGQQELPIQ